MCYYDLLIEYSYTETSDSHTIKDKALQCFGKALVVLLQLLADLYGSLIIDYMQM